MISYKTIFKTGDGVEVLSFPNFYIAEVDLTVISDKGDSYTLYDKEAKHVQIEKNSSNEVVQTTTYTVQRDDLFELRNTEYRVHER